MLAFANLGSKCPYQYFSLSVSVADAAKKQEEDFPRGGAHPLTPLEIREAKNKAENDILFGVETCLFHVFI